MANVPVSQTDYILSNPLRVEDGALLSPRRSLRVHAYCWKCCSSQCQIPLKTWFPQRPSPYEKLGASRKTSSGPSSRYRMCEDASVLYPRTGHRYNEWFAARRERQRRTVSRSVTHQPLVPAQRAARMERRPRPPDCTRPVRHRG